MAIGALIGGGLSLLGSRSAGKESRRAAEAAAEAAKFRPVDVTTGFGTGAFTPEMSFGTPEQIAALEAELAQAEQAGDAISRSRAANIRQELSTLRSGTPTGGFTAQAQLSPEFQAIANQLRGQAGAFLGMPSGIDPRLAALGQQALGGAGGFLEQALGAQARGIGGIAGLGGAFGGAAAQALGALGGFDPQQLAAAQFGRMEELLAPGRERERTALEERLLRQGRLGSTGGGVQQQALERGIEESRSRNLLEAMEQSRAVQRDIAGLATGLGAPAMGAFGQLEQLALTRPQALAGLATQLGAFGQQVEAAPLARAAQLQQLGLGALGGATGLEQMALEPLRLGGAFGGRQAQAGANVGQFLQQGAQGSSLAKLGAIQGIAGALPGLFQGFGGTGTSGIVSPAVQPGMQGLSISPTPTLAPRLDLNF